MIRFLAKRNPDLIESMDRPDCDPDTLRNTYHYFPVVNRLISRWHGVYRRFIRPELARGRTFRLLDVGSGGGDITIFLWRQAYKEGFLLDVTGIDHDPRALPFAHAAVRKKIGKPDNLRFRLADTQDLRRAGEQFDFVVCNHVLHHLADTEIKPFLDDLSQLSTRKVICSDIERSRVGYGLFSVATFSFFPNSFIRSDGLISIRKSYTRPELAKIVPDNWVVYRQFPYRLIAICDL